MLIDLSSNEEIDINKDNNENNIKVENKKNIENINN